MRAVGSVRRRDLSRPDALTQALSRVRAEFPPKRRALAASFGEHSQSSVAHREAK